MTVDARKERFELVEVLGHPILQWEQISGLEI